jgi:3-oxoacyl-[acyl-carrier protein] reductase
MELGLKGRVAIVTGSSQGIGKAIALCLSQEGAKVTICARNEDRLREAAREIQTHTRNEVLPVRANLREQENIEALVEKTATHFERIDILVNNTGGPPSATFMDTSSQQWQDASNSLLLSVVHACRAVIPHMQKTKWGRIINMTSYAAKQPIDQLILSNAIRAGILGLTKSLSTNLPNIAFLSTLSAQDGL